MVSDGPQPITILIVEDDADLGEELREGLRRYGFVAELASSARDAVTRIAQTLPDVVVVDVGLPDQDGISLVSRYAASQAGSAVRCIVITGDPNLDNAVAALRAGAVEFLRKPVAPGEIAQAVFAALRKTPRRSQERSSTASRRFEALKALEPEVDASTAFTGGNAFWKMLLALYEAEGAGSSLSVRALCRVVDVPVATGLRRLAELENAGLVCRREDEDDARRSIVSLTPVARANLERLGARATGSSMIPRSST